jgi:hypothetical protein
MRKRMRIMINSYVLHVANNSKFAEQLGLSIMVLRLKHLDFIKLWRESLLSGKYKYC